MYICVKIILIYLRLVSNVCVFKVVKFRSDAVIYMYINTIKCLIGSALLNYQKNMACSVLIINNTTILSKYSEISLDFLLLSKQSMHARRRRDPMHPPGPIRPWSLLIICTCIPENIHVFRSSPLFLKYILTRSYF